MNQGTLEDRYQIYCECVLSMGETPKSFDDWLNS
jgi:hypothetical protein